MEILERVTNHLPEFVGPRELFACTLHYLKSISIPCDDYQPCDQTYKSLLVKRAMLLLVFDIGKPWLYTARIPEEILFVYSVLIGLSTRTC